MCGFVQVACQGFLVREACVNVLVDGAVFLLSPFEELGCFSGCLIKTPISRSTLDKNSITRHVLEGNPVNEGTTRRGTDTPVHHPEEPTGSTHSSTSGQSHREQLERQAEFHSSTQDEA